MRDAYVGQHEETMMSTIITNSMNFCCHLKEEDWWLIIFSNRAIKIVLIISCVLRCNIQGCAGNANNVIKINSKSLTICRWYRYTGRKRRTSTTIQEHRLTE